MKNFRKILFAVDGSERSRTAVGPVATLAGASNAEVRVVYVWGVDAQALPGQARFEALSEAVHLVSEIAARVGDFGVRSTGVVERGPNDKVAETIVNVAKAYEADLIAIGSRGRSDFQGLLFGSVSHRVIHLSDCPVLVVPGALPFDHQEVSQILMPVANGQDIEPVVDAAITIAHGTGARVAVIHVRGITLAGEGAAWVESEDEGRQIVDEIVARLKAAGIPAQGSLTPPSSFVGQAISEEARVRKADLVLMGSRRPSDLEGLLFPSISHEVIHLLDRPVLIAQRPRAGARAI